MTVKFLNFSSDSEENGDGSEMLYGKRSEIDLYTLQLSNAIQFFSHINWKLQKITVTAPDKILFVFQIGNFEFKTCIDILDIKNLKSLTYEIRSLNMPVEQSNFQAVFKSKINKHFGYEVLNFTSLVSLETLFQRFSFLGIRSEISCFNEIILSFLFERIYEGLINEFEYVNNTFLTFVEKYAGTKFIINNQKEAQYDNIILQRVKNRI